ncbi:LysE family translocator [Pelagibius sp. Alg239-R121]|uniref:LysE family translocator n=1 Tax=Pelagibius sp. Alg239-R121 TaxID=2993448 RepID=UPI0024A6EDD9|nr:LysE family translocator [Pelagibius sp. Alg239-R121]
MPVDTFLALLVFAFVSSITPGPNNVMLLASGVNFGFWRTVPHMFGIAAGFGSLLLCVGFGLGALLTGFPALGIVLKVLGGSYLLYLAWRIAMSRSMGGAKTTTGRDPMTFAAAAAFQWVNPKAWMMSVTAMSVYSSPDAPYLSVFLVAAAFVVVNFPSVSTWVGFGTVLRAFLADPNRLKWFNIAMGSLLALTIFPMLR